MNIGEANDVATVLHALTTGSDHMGPIDTDRIAEAMHRLNRRAATALQLTAIAPASDIDTAARELAQRAEDRL